MLTVGFTFTFSDGDTLTASGPATAAPDNISGTANVNGGTGAFANSTGTFTYTNSAPKGTTSSDIPFTLTGTGSVTTNSTACLLHVSGTALAFSAFAGGSAAPSQTIGLFSTCATPIKFAVSVDAGSAGTPAPAWIGVTPLAGVTPVPLTVTADPGTMSAGSWGTLGDALLEMGSYGQARDAFQKMLDLKPSLPEIISVGLVREG